MLKPIRFGVVASGTEAHDLIATAQMAERLGFSSIALNDHFNSATAPMLGLQAMGAATSQIKIATSVLNQDLRHPAVLAKEAATWDVLSGGRLELGLGAGWVRDDYDQSGIGFDSAGTRIDRLEENIAVLRGLFGPSPFTFRGKHFAVTDLNGTPKPAQQGGPPIMVGGGGRRLLAMAARRADIVQVLGATVGSGGAAIDDLGSFRTESFEERLDWIRSAAGTRFDEIELSLMLIFISVTDDVEGTAKGFLDTLTGAVARYGGTVGDVNFELQTLLDSPVVAIGTLAEVCEKLTHVRNALGFNYFVTPYPAAMEALAPIVSRLTGT